MGELSLEAYFEGMSSQVLDLIIHKAIQEDVVLS